MTRPRAGGGRTEREREKGIETKSGAKEKRREERKKFQIVVWREDFGGGRTFGLVA
jgi:hypothetical protein